MLKIIALKREFDIEGWIAVDNGDLVLLDRRGVEQKRVAYILNSSAAEKVGRLAFDWASGRALCGRCYPANVCTSNPEYLGYWLMGVNAGLTPTTF